ncbi:unnamed protein product [Closterium sp. NIES-53]
MLSLLAMYALSVSGEGDCYLCVPPDPGIEAAALGASESALLGTASAEVLHTFTLDSGASRCFFRDSTTLTPLSGPVPIGLADPSRGPVLATSSPVLPCPTVPSGSLSSLHLPSFSTNSVSTVALQNAMVTTTTPEGQRVSIYTFTPIGRHLATFSRRPGSSLYTQATEPPQVAVSARVSASGQVAPPCSCRLLSHKTLLWSHRLGHPSLPRLRGMHPHLLVSSLSRGGEFSSDLLRDFCRGEGILQWFTLLASPQKNGIAERRIGLVMEYAAHQLNLWPHVSLLETSLTLRWTGKVGDASVFRVWGSRPFVRNTYADKLSACAIRYVFLGYSPDVPGWQFYHPTWRRVFPSQYVTFDELVPFYRLFPYCSAPPPPLPHFLAPGPPPVDSGAARGAASGGAEPGDAEPGGVEPGGVESEGAGSGGAEPGSEEPGGAEPVGVESGGAEPAGVKPGGAESGGAEPRATRAGDSAAGDTRVGGAGVAVGASGTGGAVAAGHGGARTMGNGGVGGAGAGDPIWRQCAGGAGAVDPGAPASPLPAPPPYTEQTGGLTERREPASHPASPVCTGHHVPRPRPTPIPGTHAMALGPSSVPLRVPLPPPPNSSLPSFLDPESDRTRTTSPTVSRLLATIVTDPSFESTAASALVAELLDFAAACRLDYATALVADSESASPPSVGGEYDLAMDVLEDRQEDFECLAAAVPHFASMLLASEGDPDAPDIPTPCSYAEAITGPYSSQWHAAMDAEMASWKSTGTYVNAVPLSGANIVNGMWIFRVKRPPGSPPAFKARYVARGFSQQQGVDYFQTFSPTPKMTALRGSLHEEIWLRRPPGFTGSFPAGTQWRFRRPVYGLRQGPREWHETLRTTLAALGFTPATADPLLFLHTDMSLPPFYVLVYVDDLVFATADIEALTLVKSELQKRHTCTDLGELGSYLGLQITWDKAQRTITLTQSHMVHQVLQHFAFQFSSPQPTPLSTGHSLSAPPLDETVEPSGRYPELVHIAEPCPDDVHTT